MSEFTETLPKPEALTDSSEVINQKFNGIIEGINDTLTQHPELGEELNGMPLEKPTGVSDRPKAHR